jgi:hypothetical protein
LQPNWNALQPCVREIHILFDLDLSYLQLRTTRTTQKTIKIARSQSRLRAIETERLNSRLWRTEKNRSNQPRRVSLT